MEDELYKQQIEEQSSSRSSFASRQQPSPEVDPNAPIPLTGCYNIGDPGPGGGTIFAVPVAGSSNPNYYYEVGPVDLMLGSTSTQALNLTCRGLLESNISSLGVNINISGNVLGPNQFTILWNANNFPLPQAPFNTVTHNSNASYFFPSAPNGINRITNVTPATPSQTLQQIINNGIGQIIITLQHNFNPQVISNNPSGGFLNNFTISQLPPGLVLTNTGAEWGANDRDFPTSPNFGDGRKNTDLIGALTQTAPPLSHPTLLARSIAADLCLAYSTTDADGNDYIDWFLPSIGEFQAMKSALGDPASGAYILNLQTNTSNSEHLYWTSSSWITTDPARKSFSFAFNNDLGNFNLIRKCKTLSVRPIRRFECFDEPDPDPCDYNDPNYSPTCDCVEYNFRDAWGYGGNICAGGIMLGSTDDKWLGRGIYGSGTIANYLGSYTPPAGLADVNGNPCTVSPWQVSALRQYDNCVGGTYQFLWVSNKDVMSNVFSNKAMREVPITFTIYDNDYKFLGKWRYNTLVDHVVIPQGGAGTTLPGSTGLNVSPWYTEQQFMVLTDGQHLEGNIPVLYYNDPNWGISMTHIFVKFENNNVNTSTSGCNSFNHGNLQFPLKWGDPAIASANIPGITFEGKCWAMFAAACDEDTEAVGLAGGGTGNLNASADCIQSLLINDPPGYTHSSDWVSCSDSCLSCPELILPDGTITEGYEIGDEGPAGGTIVATPWMNQGTIVPNGADENPSQFYYEIAKYDITVRTYVGYMHFIMPGMGLLAQNQPGVATDFFEWGNYSISSYAQQNLPYVNEGEKNTNEMHSNYSIPPFTQYQSNNGIPVTQPNKRVSVFDIVHSYSQHYVGSPLLQGGNQTWQFGNFFFYNWFVPSVQEWWFVRNNLPNKTNYLKLQPATTTETYSPLNFDNLYWTSNFRDANYLDSEYGTPYASDPTTGDGLAIGGTINSNLTTLGSIYEPNNLGLASDLATEVRIDPATGLILSGDTVATEIERKTPLRVRPMRKFTCDDVLNTANNTSGPDAQGSISNRSMFASRNAQRPTETGPFSVLRYFPLYDTIKGATDASPDNSGYHIHEFNGKEYYMPNGLIMGETQFHGDFPGLKKRGVPQMPIMSTIAHIPIFVNGEFVDQTQDPAIIEIEAVAQQYITTEITEQEVQEIIQPQQEVVEPEQTIEPEQTTETEDTIEPEALPTPPPAPQQTPPPPTYTPPSSGGGGGGGGY